MIQDGEELSAFSRQRFLRYDAIGDAARSLQRSPTGIDAVQTDAVSAPRDKLKAES